VGQHHSTIHVQLILQQVTAQQGMAQQHGGLVTGRALSTVEQPDE
jgi:hypothetical protein